MIALAIEGVSQSDACEALGIALGTLESHKQAIRRKLGIPKGLRFEQFVRDHFAEGVEVPEKHERAAEKPTQDRRVRWLLRITLEEASELATSAALRAQLLDQTVARMGSADVEEARSEVAELRQIAEDLRELKGRAIERIRSRGNDVSQLERERA